MTEARAIRPLDRPPDADVRVPGSKSLTNRALVAAALAHGRSRLEGVLVADDTEAMLGALRALGLEVALGAGPTVEVVGCDGAVPPGPRTIDVRQSGTTARFVAPLLALGRGSYVLDAHPVFRQRRPMGTILDALGRLGAEVEEQGAAGHLPVRLRTPGVSGGRLTVEAESSSQFLSGLLLSAPAMPRGLQVRVPGRLVSAPYVELTLDVMRAFGARVHRDVPHTYRVEPGGYRATDYVVEPDASAASYFLAAAAITGGRVRVRGLGEHSRQGDAAFADLLGRMGAEVTRDRHGTQVRGTGRLQGVDVDLSDLSDTAQTLAAVAVHADSPTRVRGIGFIRHKETDRVRAVVTELRRCGIEAEEEADGFVVRPGTPRPATVQTYDDHRMAMSFALLGLVTPGIRIADPECVAKTFPDFFAVLEGLRTVGGGGAALGAGPGASPGDPAGSR